MKSPLPLAPAYFIGTQEGLPALPNRKAFPPMDLYILTAPIPGHCEGSSVTATTLRAAGYKLPSKRVPVPCLGFA